MIFSIFYITFYLVYNFRKTTVRLLLRTYYTLIVYLLLRNYYYITTISYNGYYTTEAIYFTPALRG